MWLNLFSLWVRSFATIAIRTPVFCFCIRTNLMICESDHDNPKFLQFLQFCSSRRGRISWHTFGSCRQQAIQPCFSWEPFWGGFRWEFLGYFRCPIWTDRFLTSFLYMNEPFQRFCDLLKKGFVDASGPLTFWSERGAGVLNSSVGRTSNSKAIFWTGTPWKIHMEPRNHPGKWSSKPQWLCSIMLTFRGVCFVALSFKMIWHGDVIPGALMSDVFSAIYLGCWLDPDMWNDPESFQNG